MREDRAFALLFLAVYCAAIGFVVGRTMLRNEQARERQLGRMQADIYELQDKLYPRPSVMSEPEPADGSEAPE